MKTELQIINEKHFKGRVNFVPFCTECNLKEKVYCKKCGEKLINRVKDLR